MFLWIYTLRFGAFFSNVNNEYATSNFIVTEFGAKCVSKRARTQELSINFHLINNSATLSEHLYRASLLFCTMTNHCTNLMLAIPMCLTIHIKYNVSVKNATVLLHKLLF